MQGPSHSRAALVLVVCWVRRLANSQQPSASHPHRNLPLREAAGRQSVRAVGIGSECSPAAGTHAVRCAGCRKEECRIGVFSHRVSIVRHSQFDGSSVGFATPFGSFRSLFWSVSALFVDGFRGAKANLPPICALCGAGLAGLW